MTGEFQIPEAVLNAWDLADLPLVRDRSGLINATWIVGQRGHESGVLQALNPVFPASINDDIDTVTRHLESCGMPTTRIVKTRAQTNWCEAGECIWRLLTYVPGVTLHGLPDPALAASAGSLLARFHGALESLDIEFSNARLGVHDTRAHLRALDMAIEGNVDSVVKAVAEEIGAAAAALPALPLDRDIAVHGDPKISNIRFREKDGPAVCMLDLDTLSRMPLCLELGDALRSWCNRTTEDDDEALFSIDHFREALTGYAKDRPKACRDEDLRASVDATMTITIELAARFCADAVHDRYFAWDPSRFESRRAHNLARARSQLALARSLSQRRDSAEHIIDELLAPDD